ncbi:hypothetical protein [Chryseobacterium potabilaquae]|uniref:Uncharacterized protein n=1 Tax=Chryseobacterium potabilaquae TaxID=2675057 RepID=A0A6N4X8H8_9FLAO|nr:hypothetical protein [Chryseobacterium potabilaquae]CAA7194593.1 hypothetical protein CHRY9293_00882 [Chryseobacterium potabilaquae]
MQLLRIQSRNMEEIPELVNILGNIAEFNPAIKEYHYSISFFDGSPKENFKGSFIDFLNSINESGKGLILNSNQVQKSISKLFQIYDLLLLIDKEVTNFEKSKIKDDSFLYNNIFLTITYFDSGFWEISCLDKNLLNFIKTKQSNYEFIQL